MKGFNVLQGLQGSEGHLLQPAYALWVVGRSDAKTENQTVDVILFQQQQQSLVIVFLMSHLFTNAPNKSTSYQSLKTITKNKKLGTIVRWSFLWQCWC